MDISNEELVLFIKNQVEKLSSAIKKVEGANPPVTIDNFDEVKAHLRNELKAVSKSIETSVAKIKIPEIPDTVKVNNLGELGPALKSLQTAIKDLERKVEAIDFKPTINYTPPSVVVPEIKLPPIQIPKIEVPQPNFVVEDKSEIDVTPIVDALEPLKHLSDKPNNPLSVRISDGEAFVKAVTEASKGMTAFATSIGMTIDEFKLASRQWGGMLIPEHDIQEVDDTNPDNVTITYKKGGKTVATKSIVTNGTTTITMSYA